MGGNLIARRDSHRELPQGPLSHSAGLPLFWGGSGFLLPLLDPPGEKKWQDPFSRFVFAFSPEKIHQNGS